MFSKSFVILRLIKRLKEHIMHGIFFFLGEKEKQTKNQNSKSKGVPVRPQEDITVNITRR